MATGDVYRIGIEWSLNAQARALTTFGLVEGTGLGGPNPMADVASSVEEALGPTPVEAWPATTQLTAIVVSDVQPATRGGYRLPLSGLAGTVVADALPPQDAIVVSIFTGLKGKANNGRMFLPPMSETLQVSGFWSQDAIDPASGFFSRLYDKFVNDGTEYQMHVLSYVPASSPRVLRAAVPVTAFTIDNVVRTMRSRQNGRGQ